MAVQESPRSQKLKLRIGGANATGVDMLVPVGTPDQAIDRFLRDHHEWVERTLTDHLAKVDSLGLLREGVVWRLGRPLRIVRARGERSQAFTGMLGSEMVLGVSGQARDWERAIDRWCREELRKIAAARIDRMASEIGVEAKQLRVADQSSRWGSASTTGTLSLNWRLLLAPEEVLDYVIVHELCHFLEMNHSHRFWALVDIHDPDWRDQKRWLSAHGPALRAWSPAVALGVSA